MWNDMRMYLENTMLNDKLLDTGYTPAWNTLNELYMYIKNYATKVY